MAHARPSIPCYREVIDKDEDQFPHFPHTHYHCSPTLVWVLLSLATSAADNS